MSKKHWAWLLMIIGVLMIYSLQQLKAGKTDASTTLGKLENDLANWSVMGSPTAAPLIAYAAIGAGAYLAFF